MGKATFPAARGEIRLFWEKHVTAESRSPEKSARSPLPPDLLLGVYLPSGLRCDAPAAAHDDDTAESLVDRGGRAPEPQVSRSADGERNARSVVARAVCLALVCSVKRLHS